MGNPFLSEGDCLITLPTQDMYCGASVETVMKVEKICNSLYQNFVEERLLNRTKSLSEVINRNSVVLFDDPKVKVPSKERAHLMSAKNDVSLFLRMYIGCQSRGGDIKEFFSHENQGVPPALSDCGKL